MILIVCTGPSHSNKELYSVLCIKALTVTGIVCAARNLDEDEGVRDDDDDEG